MSVWRTSHEPLVRCFSVLNLFTSGSARGKCVLGLKDIRLVLLGLSQSAGLPLAVWSLLWVLNPFVPGIQWRLDREWDDEVVVYDTLRSV